ncbi:MAG: hypothetical protein KIH64_015835 [Mycobacterium sp.]|nr:hypothetical protein [Mycobacterium sp.]
MSAPTRWASAALALAVTAPLVGSGYLLIRDAVSTPRSYLSDGAIGLGEAAPRAVPQDFAVASLSAVVDGGIVVKALLIAGLFLAGWGAARLAGAVLPRAGIPGQLVAATVAVWNPYVAERLLQGHWSLLVAYGCLPWVAAAVIGLRTDEAGHFRYWTAVVFWIALAGLTPTGAMLAAVVALVCVAVPGDGLSRSRCAAGIAASAAVAAVPWLTASLLGSGLATSQTTGLAAFAPRAEPLLGTLGSLAGLGGIWNAEAVPHSRTTGLALVGTVLLLMVVACGVPAVLRARTGEPLLALAAFSVLFSAAMATGPGLSALKAAVNAAPGLAVLRDGQKWVACAMPGYVIAAAGAVLLLQRWMRPGLAAVLCCAAVVAALPDLAWGVGGQVRPVHYPAGWQAAADRINAGPAAGAVLRADTRRQFAWAGTAPVLDPVPRWVRADVLATGDLLVSGQTVPGEGGRARAVQKLLESGAAPEAVARAGVGWLLVERGTPGTMGSADRTLQRLTPVYSDPDIALYRIGGTSQIAAHRIPVIAAHLVWAITLAAGAVGLIAARWRRGAHT